MKKRILYNGEVSYAFSGYGKYARNLLQRLHNSGKYEVAEFASYAVVNDGRNYNIPWKFYANMVTTDDPRYKSYLANPSNSFGEWRFARVLLDFKPDVVISIRDIWVDKYIQHHPFRKFFNWVYCPTYDSFPSKPEWLDTYLSSDVCLGYTEWAIESIKKECPKVNTYKAAPPPADTQVFKPVADKTGHKRAMGLPEDSIIIGMVGRNQIRKLFPQLFKAFRLFLDHCVSQGRKELADRSLLYIHSSYPDLQYWDFPLYLKEYGISSKVLFTYICRECNTTFCAKFQDARAVCPKCFKSSAAFPSVNAGVKEEELSLIYNLMDAYIQYVTCEGRGMPMDEASACGVPIFTPNYSAMEDFVKYDLATPILAHKHRDIGIGAERVQPDDNDFVNQLYKYLSLPVSLRRLRERKVASNYRKVFSWEDTTKVWEEAIEMTGNPPRKWDEAPKFLPIPNNIPPNLNDSDFINFLFNIIGEPEYSGGFMATGLIRDLYYNHSITAKYFGVDHLTRENLFTVFCNIARHKNEMENFRLTKNLPIEDYIAFANRNNK